MRKSIGLLLALMMVFGGVVALVPVGSALAADDFFIRMDLYAATSGISAGRSTDMLLEKNDRLLETNASTLYYQNSDAHIYWDYTLIKDDIKKACAERYGEGLNYEDTKFFEEISLVDAVTGEETYLGVDRRYTIRQMNANDNKYVMSYYRPGTNGHYIAGLFRKKNITSGQFKIYVAVGAWNPEDENRSNDNFFYYSKRYTTEKVFTVTNGMHPNYWNVVGGNNGGSDDGGGDNDGGNGGNNGNTETPTPEPVDKEGWNQSGSNWFYVQNGKRVTGWKQVGSAWYFFDGSGNMQTGWVQDGSAWYYLNPSGSMATSWKQDGGNWYFLGTSGKMAVGWQEIGGKWYWFTSSGKMVTGWKQMGSIWYYFNPNGSMQTSWKKIDGVWYYFKSSGAMAANETITIGGVSYKFAASGAWVQ